MKKDCLFCKIIAGEIPCAKVYEDDGVIAFLDIAPAAKGHALVVPKKHYETLLDLPDEFSFLAAIKKIARAQSAALGSEGFNVLVNNKKVAGQIVPHVHAHIIPRKGGDGVKMEWRPHKYKEDEIHEFADKIRKFL